MMLPLVTVICNCFNHEGFVLQAIQSVLNQTYKNIELIVINNGSTDNSSQIISTFLKQYPEIKYINLPETISITKAFNKAAKYANGVYFIDLAADDVLLEDCIEKQTSFFSQQSDNVALIFGNAYHINENGQKLKPYFPVNDNNNVIDSSLFNTNYVKLLSSGLSICSVSAMFTKKHFELLNGFNEDLFFEDLDYWLRLSRQFEIKFIDDFLVEKRFLENSLGNQFYDKKTYSKNINKSLRIIYNQSLKRNISKEENKALLKRIHFSMDKCLKNKLWLELFKFSIIKLKCHLYLLK
ncbi:glycosyltransferase [Flavobacterium sp. xlx-214]|uniref:glycosyltransferase family 2 protein n=1 Tax=unclassified Flavobacterium TaxID=196869 RepID=UPI0013D3D276|nr:MULTISPECIES: glycosyltransferase [unclassified Flavobacterium]MBA5791367.1 glycosyltransferase [Flavobacterium sp. xlx-221]QMI83480.1 glycosyltransferase [Flavobacterium sp. xlx-214]